MSLNIFPILLALTLWPMTVILSGIESFQPGFIANRAMRSLAAGLLGGSLDLILGDYAPAHGTAGDRGTDTPLALQ
jgi:hypothetical protein